MNDDKNFIFFFLLLRLQISTMTVKVEAVTESRELGEGPHWDHERQHLYYVDAFKSAVHRYIPSEQRDTCCKIGE